jgi:hypothetical protein
MYFYLFLTVIESATNVNPENNAKGIALAIKYSGTKSENIVLKNKKVESNATNAKHPKKIKGNFFVILKPPFVLILRYLVHCKRSLALHQLYVKLIFKNTHP